MHLAEVRRGTAAEPEHYFVFTERSFGKKHCSTGHTHKHTQTSVVYLVRCVNTKLSVMTLGTAFQRPLHISLSAGFKSI